MFERLLRTTCLSSLIAAACFSTNPAWATAITHSNLSFHSLGITPSTGTVQFTDPWILETQASTNNSLGDFDSNFNEIDGPSTSVSGATATWISASGVANDPAPTAPYLDISGGGVANGNIPGQIDGSAFAQGSGIVGRDDLFVPGSFFEITGGPDGGLVGVTFSILIDYALNVTTDQYGVLAEAKTSFRQELFTDALDLVLFNEFNDFLSIGSNQHLDRGGYQHASNTYSRTAIWQALRLTKQS